MKNTQKEFSYHIWNGPDLKASAYGEVQLPDGAVVHGKIGDINIKKGDVLYLDYGRSMGVYTRSGKGYESEFKYGKVTLHGCPVAVELKPGENQHLSNVISTKEDIEPSIKKQQERVNPQINEIKDLFIFHEVKRRQEIKAAREASEQKRKERIQDAVSQMDAFFNRPKKP